MKTLVIVTSIINISNNPLSYTNVRSVYNHDERFEQTIKTIESLNKINNKDVLLIECSKIDPEKEKIIKEKIDFYINLNEDQEVKAVVNGPHKGSGEAIKIYKSLEKINFKKYDNIVKLSGRYWLNDNFKEDILLNNLTLFKESQNKDTLSTVFYKINKKEFNLYLETLKKIILTNKMMESEFLNNFNNVYTSIENVGVMGYISVNGLLWEI